MHDPLAHEQVFAIASGSEVIKTNARIEEWNDGMLECW